MTEPRQRKQFEKRWQSRFAEFAKLREDDAGIAGWSSWGLQTRLRFFTTRWGGATPGALYLDAGCGAGTYSRWLADSGLQVIGVDYSYPSLSKARQRDAVSVSYCAADASRLPFADHSIDGVLCFGVLQAVWNSKPFVTELARVLKPGGELWIDALNAQGVRAAWDITTRRMRGKPMHLRYESPRELVTTLREAGFDEISRHWLPIMPAGLRKLQAVFESKPVVTLLHAMPLLGAVMSHSVVIRGVLANPRSSVGP